MPYYDSIAKPWHQATGYKGGALKELLLNDLLLAKIPAVHHHHILELGAGNGYLMPLLLRRFSGQQPAAVTITDQSPKLLEIAQRHFPIEGATYQRLDAGRPFPFPDGRFHLIIASMLLNELPPRPFKNALKESHRALAADGRLLITVTHPDFINSLHKRGLLKPTQDGILTMPGAGGLRLPVVIRSLPTYRTALQEAGFTFAEETIYPTPELLNAKTGLRHAGNLPIALLYTCTKST
jgi:SAM-dependent methyltransferase